MSALAARIVLIIAVALVPRLAGAQAFDFVPPATATDPALPAALRDLAERVLPVYQENHPDRYLANLAALQMAVGDPAAARATRVSLRERLQSEQAESPAGQPIVYDIYTQARATEATEHTPFQTAYAQAFRETLDSLDDLAAYGLEDWFVAPIEPLREMLQRALDARRGKTSIELDEALDLVRDGFGFDAYRSFGALVRPLLAEDRDKRYVIDDDVAIPVAKDATIAAALVRPRDAAKTANAADAATLPTLLEFTLDKSSRDPREAAAHGYASVLALSRIAGDPNVRPRAPFESDGDDARAVIAWIAKQPWSDGRVGMQGVGYGGFVAWSAAKRRPAALQAIATSDPMAPGIDVPMANGIFSNSAYRWVYGLLEAPEGAAANDADRWRSLDEEWFRAGGWYRGFPSLPGPASAVFRSWLNHPSYDRFWQKWLPFGEEFGHIGIPVLTITGYYSGGETASLYYFTEHHRHDANADHTLLIGPFDERTAKQGTASSVRGLSLDPVALIDAEAVRYEWFDAVLKGAKRPELLAGTVNYQLEGANEWRHEPSLEALEAKPRRFYLQASASGAAPQALVTQKPAAPMSLTQTLDLGERTEIRWGPTQDLVVKNLEPLAGVLFMTEPFAEPIALAGRLRGVLDFTINKYDVDLVVSLYELRSNGDYVKLFDPAYAFRASYARDRVHRHLLKSGVRQQLPFQSPRMVGRTLPAGSRLVLTLGINKRADQQINYGTAGEVSEDSIDVAGAPVRIRWHEGSYIEIGSP
jgi:putative CocE/NonD family hydrolase